MMATTNKVLKPTGFELRRIGPTISGLKSRSRKKTAGKTIEFIGVQGVGKSTLNNDTYEFFKKNWFFRSDLGQIGPAASSHDRTEKLHRELFFQAISCLQERQPDPWKSITVARQMSKVISESLTIMNNDFPRGFILDEGLFKNFPREVLGLGSSNRSPLWTNRAFIYLRASDPDFVVARYQERADERSNLGLPQRRMPDVEVRARIEQESDLFDRILEKAMAFGCPALTVRVEDDHKKNIGKILSFERSFLSMD